MIGKNEILKVNSLIFSYILELEDSEINGLIEGSKIISIADIKEKSGEFKKSEVLKNVEEFNKSKEIKKIDDINNIEEIKKEELKKEELKKAGKIKVIEKLEEVKEDEVIVETINKINKFTTREDANLYLNKKMFTVKLLKVIAKKGDIYLKSKSKKAEIIDKIIEATVGASLKHKILKEG